MVRPSLLIILALLSGSCASAGPTESGPVGISPQPIPAPGKDVRFDARAIELRAGAEPGATELRGSASALSWAPGKVWAFGLEARSRGEATVNDDGSFIVSAGGTPGQTFRLFGIYVATDGSYRASLDVTAPNDAGGAARAPALEACLARGFVGAWLDAGSAAVGTSATVHGTLSNRCARELTVKVAWTSGASFSIESPSTVVLSRGGTADLAIRFVPAAPGVTVELVLLDVGGPLVAVSVVGVATN